MNANKNILSSIEALIKNHKLPHAILLAETNKDTIKQVVETYGKFLLNSPSPLSHLDFFHLAPTGKSWEIKIENVREMIDFSQKSPKIANNKAIFIEHADRLNKNSANSILKTLEEPTSGTFFILSTNSLEQILPTIKSRCAILLNNNDADNKSKPNDTTIPHKTTVEKNVQFEEFLTIFNLKLRDFYTETNKTLKILKLNSIIKECEIRIKSLGESFSMEVQNLLFSEIEKLPLQSLAMSRASILSAKTLLSRISTARTLTAYNINFISSLEFILLGLI